MGKLDGKVAIVTGPVGAWGVPLLPAICTKGHLSL